jgi:drug/metabolite transporter (DMT)-like permease
VSSAANGVPGVVWMGGAVLSLSTMAVAGRELLSSMHAVEIVFWRTVVGLVVLAVFFFRYGRPRLRAHRLDLHIYRNLAHVGAQALWFLALGLMPLANVFALEFTTPIWGSLLAVLFLGERFTRAKAIALACGFAGVLIIVRPGFGGFNLSSFVVLGATIGFATAITMTKALARRDSAMTILVYMNVIQMPIAFLMSVTVWTMPTPGDIPWLIVVGLSNLSAHLCLARSLAVADASVVMPVDFLRLPVIAVVGYLLYQESLELVILFGAGIIFLGNFYNVRRESAGARG